MNKELPEGWVNVVLQDLFSHVTGGDWGLDPETIGAEGFSKAVCIRGGELRNWRIDKGKTASIRLVKDSSINTRRLKIGDILLEISGGGPDQPVGRTVIIDGDVFKNHPELPKVCTNFLRLIRLVDIVNKQYINQYLQYFYSSGEVVKYQGGSNNLRNLKFGDYSSIKIPLPPFPEQQRIVAKLDTLFGQLDKIKTHLERIPQLLKDFRQKVLTQAVAGKLTEGWREGKKLIGIELKKNKYEIEFEFLELYDFPETWNYIALGNYAECSRGKFTARPRNDPQFFDGEYPFMQIGDLPGNGGLFYSYSSTLNEKGKSVSKCFPKGTVVIAIVGATIGNTGILEKEIFFPDSLIGINSENPFSNFYIEYFLRYIKYKIRELSYAGGGQPNIKMPNITNLGIAIPPIEEQQEIVRRVESLFSKADKIETQYKTLKVKIEQLPQAILAKAFRGELVEQLPTDGDAKDLLEEIKKLKGEGNGAGKGKKLKPEEEMRMVAEDGVNYGKK